MEKSLMNDDLCYCGMPLHYQCKKTEKQMNEIVQTMGRYTHVVHNDKTYKVDRHFIALHGIRGDLMHAYGFDEVKNGCKGESEDE